MQKFPRTKVTYPYKTGLPKILESWKNLKLEKLKYKKSEKPVVLKQFFFDNFTLTFAILPWIFLEFFLKFLLEP